MNSNQKIFLFLFFSSAALASFFHFFPKRYLLGDEATELLQAMDLPLDTFYTLVPSFKSTWVVPGIEPLFAYLNRWIFEAVGATVFVPKIILILTFAFTVVISFFSIRKFLNAQTAWIATTIYATSFYSIGVNQFLTRNALSPIWCIITLTFLCMFSDEQYKDSRSKSLFAVGIFSSLLLGLFTYSAFKIYFAALFFSSLLFFLIERNFELLKKTFFIFLFTLSTYLFLLDQTQGVEAVMSRGNYTLVEKVYLFESLWRTFLWPILYSTNSFFLGGTGSYIGGQSTAFSNFVCSVHFWNIFNNCSKKHSKLIHFDLRLYISFVYSLHNTYWTQFKVYLYSLAIGGHLNLSGHKPYF